MKDTREADKMHKNTGGQVGEGVTKGVTTGAVVGGVAGFLAGTVVPALGGFLIGGPIGAAFGLTGAAATTVSGVATGVVAGGLVGALTNLGLPKDEAENYESRIKGGAILLAVAASDMEETQSIKEVFDRFHASEVRTLSHEESSEQVNEAPTHRATSGGYQYAGAKGGATTRPYNKRAGAKGGTTAAYASGQYVNPIQVEKYLKGMDFPASKDQVIQTAKDEGADQDVLHTLQDMPGDNFDSPREISKAIGKME